MLTVAKKPEKSVKFGERLRELRTTAGLTLAALGELSGVHFQAIAKLERGVGEPTWRTVQKLAEALNVSTDVFKDVDE